MGRQQYVVRTGAVALSANATKSIILIPPSSSSLFTIVEIGFSIDSSVAAPAIGLELYAVTTLGSPAGTNFTPVLVKRGTSITAQTGNGLINLSTEPTTVEVIKDWFVPPTGLLVVQFPLGREPESFTGTSNRIGLRYVNPSTGSTANYRAYIEFEE
jgi:hypothetical protein